MLPIKDTIRSRSFPIITWLLIAINLLAFIFETSLSTSGLNRLILTFGLVPARLDWSAPATLYPLFTNMFLHGGWFHVLSNMWFLFIFGDNVEDRLGSGRYLVFYLLGGVAASTLQALVDPASTVPAIGASGAIAAVLGAYFFFFPHARIITLIFIFIFPWFLNIPAILYLGVWFLLQFFNGLAAVGGLSGAGAGGVAWWAHVGGFLFGLALAAPFGARRRLRDWYPDEYRPW